MVAKRLLPAYHQMGLLILAVVSVLASSEAKAPAEPLLHYGNWRHSILGGGGYIQNVVLCPSDAQRAYAYVDNSGIFRSDDGGRAWRIIHGTMPVSFGIYDVRGLVVDPRDADKIIAAIGTQWDKPWGIFLSDDGGKSWTQTLVADFFGGDEHRFSGFVLQRHPNRPDELTVASGVTGAFRSTDNGRTWKKLGLENIFATDLKYDRSNPDRLWVCALKTQLRARYKEPIPGGFFLSEDNGLTWKKLADESPSEIVQDPKDPGRLYGIFNYTHIRTSADAGRTWADYTDGLELVKPGERPSGNHPRAYYALAAGPDFVLTATGMGQFYRLKCGTATWQRVQREGLTEHYAGRPWHASVERGVQGHFGSALGSITVDPMNPQRWFFTDFYAIYQTLDAGKNWFLSCDGVDATVIFCVTQDPHDGGVVHLGMADNGHFLSEDGGQSFARGNTGNQNTKCISVSRADPTRVYALGSGLSPEKAGMKSCQVYVSIDRGRTWAVSPMAGLPDLAAGGAWTIEADPKDPLVAYLAVSGPIKPDGAGVWRTRDGGRSWQWIGQGLPNGKWYFHPHIWNIGRELAAGPDGTLVATGSSGVYRRAAGADVWMPATRGAWGGNEIVADPHYSGHFYLAAEGNGGVFKSEDGGATWTQVYKGSSRHVAVDFAKPGRIVAGLADGVVLSVDGGKTWKTLDASLPYRFQPLVAFAGDRVVVGTVGNGCFWTALSSAAEKPAAARLVTPSYCSKASLAKAIAPPGDLTDADKAPARWTAPAKLRVVRDSATFKSGSASLRFESDDAAGGTFTQVLDVPPGSTDQPWFAGGWVRCEGELTLASLSIYCMGKSGTWIGLINAPATRDWLEFSRAINIPADATKIRLQLSLQGRGTVWLDELNIAVGEVWESNSNLK